MASKGDLSHAQVLLSSEYTLKRCFDLHKVVPVLLDQKSLPKSFRKKAKLAEKVKNVDILIGAATELSLDGFAVFLESLDSLQDEKHNEALSVLSSEIRLMTLPPEAQATKVIQKIVEAHYHETVTKDEPEVKPSFESTYSTEEELHLSTSLPPPPETPATMVMEKLIEQIAIVEAEPKIGVPSSEGICATEKDQTCPSHLPPLPPPTPTLGNVESQAFTNAGGMFYSSTHGVCVHIPQESLPPTIQPFELKMTASLRGPYKFSEDCELCTAVIHLSCNPPIGEFCDWVTVEIPHCATEPHTVTDCDLDHLCILTAKDELISGVYEFHEDPEIEVDFSYEYKVVFKTKHFSGSTGARLKGRKRMQKSILQDQRSQHHMKLRSKKQGSLDSHYRSMLEGKTSAEIRRSASLPSSNTTRPSTEGGNDYYVSMCTPLDRGHPHWKAVFLISYNHPTGLKEIKEAAERILGTRPEIVTNSFTFNGSSPAVRCIEFVPESWEDEGWKVESIKHPAVIAERDVLNYFQLPEDTKEILNFSPNSLQYSVEGRNRLELLSLRIHVKNSRFCGKEVSFLLTSTAAYSPAAENQRGSHYLHIISDLYESQSQFWHALSTSDNVMQDLPLRIDDNDTRKFFTEISFQLPSWKGLASELQLEQLAIACLEDNYRWKFEVAYQMLRKWITEKPHVATLCNLLTALKAKGLFIKPCSWQIKFQSLQHILCNNAHLEVHNGFACGLSERIGSQWKFVARQLGVPEYNIDNIECQEHMINEQAYQMLLKWKAISGRNATYGVLVNAIFAVDEHTNCLNDACCYIERYISHLA